MVGVAMSIKYYDIVPKNEGTAEADDFRRALVKAGFEPADKAGFRWRSSSGGEKLDVYLMAFREPCLFYSNTRTLKVTCPFCRAPISLADWHRAVSDWRAGGGAFITPCCGKKAGVRQLIYDPPVYFARTALSVCTRGDCDPPSGLLARISRAVGRPLGFVERLC